MTRTILLIEDSEDDVFFMKRAFKAVGVPNPVQVVMDGQSAIDYLAGQNAYTDRSAFPMPSLVFLDLRLPMVPGMEVLKWARAQAPLIGLPIIVLTSSRHDVDVLNAYTHGANAFLVKPSDSAELQEMVRLTIQFWLKFNQAPDFQPTDVKAELA